MNYSLSISLDLSQNSRGLGAYNHGQLPEIYSTDSPARPWSSGRETYNNVAHYSGVFATIDEALQTVAQFYPQPHTRQVRYVAVEVTGDDYENERPTDNSRLWRVEQRWSHPNRSKSANTAQGYVIQLSSRRLWKNFGAADAAIFSTRENAESTLAGFSAAPALQGARVLRLTSATDDAAQKVGGYFVAEI